MMTQIALTVSFAFGTVKSRIAVTGTRKADRRSHGRALPSLVFVRSMICPMITFVMASITFEMIGKIARNRPFHKGVRFRTSV